jgi:hypothetical protein
MLKTILKMLVTTLLLCWIAVFSYNTGHDNGFSAGAKSRDREVADAKSDAERSRSALLNSPYGRVAQINSRYHEILDKYGIDPNKEGVFK